MEERTILYVGERLADVDFVSRALDITHLEAYTRVDIRGQVRITPRFEVFAVSENLLDAEYSERLSNPSQGLPLEIVDSWVALGRCKESGVRRVVAAPRHSISNGIFTL